MKFLKDEGTLLKEPSPSGFMVPTLDWLERSRDMFLVFWLRKTGVVGGVSPTTGAFLAPWLEMLINLEALLVGVTTPLSDRESGKNIPK